MLATCCPAPHFHTTIPKIGLETETVKSNQILLNFFGSSTFWSKQLHIWDDENDVSHGLSTFFKTQWYLMAKLCLGIQSHEEGFKRCLAISLNPNVDSLKMASALVKVINDHEHFTSNQILVSLLKPMVNSIDCLEHAATCLSDIWKELFTIYLEVKSINTHA
ncbi:hypothetical protein O181_036026 [Austropuccinia psidii MF-1]|uniref:Uncharacterized protein n=1 Tax=Austropuccinia psidii MF-1 TaxID=1389203 RepID=A0A9Q3D9E5_9BASI|nr:hypothetical protein [Austropuccinia psidii MF-1]